MDKKEILFIKMGSFSQINNNVRDFLINEFPENKITVYEIIRQEIKFIHYIINVFFFITEYGPDILSRRKKWKDSIAWFFATSYVSQQISRNIRHKHKNKDYLFTVQTQSLFNGKLPNIPHFVYTDHTTQTNKLYPDIHPKQYMKSERFISKVEQKIYNDATLIFTFGSLISWSLVNQYKIPSEKVVTAFAGSNVSITGPVNEKKFYNKNILFVGMNWERKGGPILIEVFKNIQSKYPDATLTIVGCNPAIGSLTGCRIVGKIPVEEVPKYYNNASVFCLPTLREPFGIVFIEAMKYRLPIVANNIGSLPDIVKNDYNGYLINNDVKGYTDAISTLFEDPQKCMQMGENGYKLTEEKFSWQIVGKKFRASIQPYIL